MTIDPRVALLFSLPRLVELRWLGRRRMSLFTDNLSVIYDAIGSSEVAGLDSYVVINPLLADVVERHRAVRDHIFGPLKGQCSADADASHRDLLPWDFDPCREVGTAATPVQRDFAAASAERAITYLVKAGFPDPVADVDSGNGRHNYFRADLPNNRETNLLITALYSCVARKFDTPEVKLDKSVRSAGQLMRLPGTRNHKAGRACEIVSFTETAGAVSVDHVHKVVADLRGQLGYKTPLVIRKGAWSPALMEKFLAFYDIDYLPGVEVAQGVLYVLNPCPFSADHVGSSPAMLITKSGFPKFCCMHASCQMTWRQFRTRLHGLTGKWFLTGIGAGTKEGL
jgi:hypothetical protein